MMDQRDIKPNGDSDIQPAHNLQTRADESVELLTPTANPPIAPLRSAEKSRKSTCAFADTIATTAIGLFRGILEHPSVGIAYKQTVMSAICVRYEWSEYGGSGGGDAAKSSSPSDNNSENNGLRVAPLGCSGDQNQPPAVEPQRLGFFSDSEACIEVVSLGSGTKYLATDFIKELISEGEAESRGLTQPACPDNDASENAVDAAAESAESGAVGGRRAPLSSRVKDMHGEILAMRGFRFYLALEAIKCLKSKSAKLKGSASEHPSETFESSRIFLLNRSKGRLEVRRGVSFHMYTSSQPCGNASVKKWAAGGIGPTYPGLSPSGLPRPVGASQHFLGGGEKDAACCGDFTSSVVKHAPVPLAPAQHGSISVLYKRPRYTAPPRVESQSVKESKEPTSAPIVGSLVYDDEAIRSSARVVECHIPPTEGRQQHMSRLPLFDYTELPNSCAPIGGTPLLGASDAPSSAKPLCTPVPSAAVTISKCKLLTCSDKIMQRNVLGYQGKGLVGLIGRIHVSSLIVGRKFTAKTAERAVCCRVDGVKGGQCASALGTTKQLRRPPKGTVCILPYPFGTFHMECLSAGTKMDEGVYVCAPSPSADHPCQETTEKETDGSGADFSDTRCLAWVLATPSTITNALRRKNADLHGEAIHFGTVVVLDGVSGQAMHSADILSEGATSMSEPFLSSQSIADVCSHVSTALGEVKSLLHPIGYSSESANAQTDNAALLYQQAKQTLRSTALPFIWA